MAIRRWDPLRDLLSLQERMNRLFEESLSRWRPDESPFATGNWSPSADVYETSDAFVVQMELPGLSEDDVEVEVEGDRVTLRGERQMSVDTRPECFHRMERSYGSFCRSFSFGEAVEAARMQAELKDGLLRIDLPKARSRRGRGERE